MLSIILVGGGKVIESETKRRYNDIYLVESKVLEIMEEHKKINPGKISLRIILSYFIIGIVWILFSDKILDTSISHEGTYRLIQLYKGWIFVGASSMAFYFIIFKNMKLFKEVTDNIYYTYEELAATHEELIAMEQELHDQVDLLNKSRTSLMEGNRRYELIVAGSNDGIWHWDYKTGKKFYSLPFKERFAYEEDDFKSFKDPWLAIVHPEDLDYFLENFKNFMDSDDLIYEDICRIRTKAGDYRWIYCRGMIERGEDGSPIYAAGSHTDITEEKKMEKKLYNLAYYDRLTKLPNKYFLQKYVEEKIKELKGKRSNIFMIYLDIDNFRNINETMGHFAGDQLIERISRIIKSYIEGDNLVTRMGGDEFVLVLLDSNIYEIREVLGKIVRDINEPWNFNDHSFFVTISAGISMYPDHGGDFESLYQNADIALSHVKENGKNNYSFFTKEMTDKAWKHIEMDKDLKIALEKDEFQLYYQPQINLRTNQIMGAEALIRWLHPKKGYIAPVEFIPFAEKVGYIHQISKWVLEEACKQKSRWKEEGYNPIKISVNLSGAMLTFKSLAENTGSVLEIYEIEDNGIEFEVTETSVIGEVDKSIYILNQLKNLNMTIALDDFGTGYSSLTYLKELPIDLLKIDRKFVSDIGKSEKESSILKYIIELAHTLDLKVLAEGVETKEQLDFLKENNCDFVQGYYFYKPMTASEIEKLFNKS